MLADVWLLAFATFLCGLPSAWAWGEYFYAFERRQAAIASLWDGLIILTSNLITLTLWAVSGDDIRILLAWLFSNMLGTYLVVWNKKRGSSENSDCERSAR